MDREPSHSPCQLCGRVVPSNLITLHHLTPRQKGGKAEHRTPLCKPCHNQIHATFSNTDLLRSFNSIAALQQAPQLQPFLSWIRRQKPDRNFKTAVSSDAPRSKRERLRIRRTFR